MKSINKLLSILLSLCLIISSLPCQSMGRSYLAPPSIASKLITFNNTHQPPTEPGTVPETQDQPQISDSQRRKKVSMPNVRDKISSFLNFYKKHINDYISIMIMSKINKWMPYPSLKHVKIPRFWVSQDYFAYKKISLDEFDNTSQTQIDSVEINVQHSKDDKLIVGKMSLVKPDGTSVIEQVSGNDENLIKNIPYNEIIKRDATIPLIEDIVIPLMGRVNKYIFDINCWHDQDDLRTLDLLLDFISQKQIPADNIIIAPHTEWCRERIKQLFPGLPILLPWNADRNIADIDHLKTALDDIIADYHHKGITALFLKSSNIDAEVTHRIHKAGLTVGTSLLSEQENNESDIARLFLSGIDIIKTFNPQETRKIFIHERGRVFKEIKQYKIPGMHSTFSLFKLAMATLLIFGVGLMGIFFIGVPATGSEWCLLICAASLTAYGIPLFLFTSLMVVLFFMPPLTQENKFDPALTAIIKESQLWTDINTLQLNYNYTYQLLFGTEPIWKRFGSVDHDTKNILLDKRFVMHVQNQSTIVYNVRKFILPIILLLLNRHIQLGNIELKNFLKDKLYLISKKTGIRSTLIQSPIKVSIVVLLPLLSMLKYFAIPKLIIIDYMAKKMRTILPRSELTSRERISIGYTFDFKWFQKTYKKIQKGVLAEDTYKLDPGKIKPPRKPQGHIPIDEIHNYKYIDVNTNLTLDDQTELRRIGIEKMKGSGRKSLLARILAAGGRGTRWLIPFLPKCLINLLEMEGKQRSFLSLFFSNARHTSKELGIDIPHILMTSTPTTEMLLNSLYQHDNYGFSETIYYYEQRMARRLYIHHYTCGIHKGEYEHKDDTCANCKRNLIPQYALFNAKISQIENYNPTGHFDIFTHLILSGQLKSLMQNGIKYLKIGGTSNVLNTLDPLYVGLLEKSGKAMIEEVVSSDSKPHGLFIDYNGRLRTTAPPNLPDAFIKQLEESPEERKIYPDATMSYWVSIEKFLPFFHMTTADLLNLSPQQIERRIGQIEDKVPIYLVHKNAVEIDRERGIKIITPVVQLETCAADITSSLFPDAVLFVESGPERFREIKCDLDRTENVQNYIKAELANKVDFHTPRRMREKELIPIYGDDHTFYYDEIPKDEVHRRGLLHKSIRIVIGNTQGKILLVKRGHRRVLSPGKWTLGEGHLLCFGKIPERKPNFIRTVYQQIKDRYSIDIDIRRIEKITEKDELTNYRLQYIFDNKNTAIPLLSKMNTIRSNMPNDFVIRIEGDAVYAFTVSHDSDRARKDIDAMTAGLADNLDMTVSCIENNELITVFKYVLTAGEEANLRLTLERKRMTQEFKTGIEPALMLFVEPAWLMQDLEAHPAYYSTSLKPILKNAAVLAAIESTIASTSAELEKQGKTPRTQFIEFLKTQKITDMTLRQPDIQDTAISEMLLLKPHARKEDAIGAKMIEETDIPDRQLPLGSLLEKGIEGLFDYEEFNRKIENKVIALIFNTIRKISDDPEIAVLEQDLRYTIALLQEYKLASGNYFWRDLTPAQALCVVINLFKLLSRSRIYIPDDLRDNPLSYAATIKTHSLVTRSSDMPLQKADRETLISD